MYNQHLRTYMHVEYVKKIITLSIQLSKLQTNLSGVKVRGLSRNWDHLNISYVSTNLDSVSVYVQAI